MVGDSSTRSARKHRRTSSPAPTSRNTSEAPTSVFSDTEAPRKKKNRSIRETFDEKYEELGLSPEEVRGEFFPSIYCITRLTIVLDRQVTTWSSKIYKHFQSPPAIEVGEDGIIRYRFVCKEYVLQYSITHITY